MSDHRKHDSAEQEPNSDELEVRIRGLMMDPVTNMPMVVLKHVDGEAILPIWIGAFEANAVAMELEKIAPPRPMTHDLIRNVLRSFDVTVSRVVISELKEDTFYAIVWMERSGEVMSLDARPSDALAIAMRADAPIFVHRSVLEHARLSQALSPTSSAEDLRRWLEGLGDDDMGQYKM